MSKETSQWLNTRTLIGFTDKRGHAWHYRESDQGIEPNHYPQAVPVADVERRLLNFTLEEEPVYVKRGPLFVPVEKKKAISTSDNGDVIEIHSDGYGIHQYKTWLIDNVKNLLDGEVSIGSALLLRNRGVAVVQLEVPDNFETPEGVTFRSSLLAATSADGSLKSIYKRAVTRVVCDNTCEAALREKGEQISVRHTRNSAVRIAGAREALGLIYDTGDAYAAELRELCATDVSEKEWQAVLDALVPAPEASASKRSITIAEKKRDTLNTLWKTDERVEPWKNTAFGVSQAFNTYQQHFATVKGATRPERNFDNLLFGKTGQQDRKVLSTLAIVQDKELVPA